MVPPGMVAWLRTKWYVVAVTLVALVLLVVVLDNRSQSKHGREADRILTEMTGR